MSVRLRSMALAFAMVCYLSLPAAVLAKGGPGGGHSSGGHGGGHSSGGHSGGHASSGHGSGHASGAHASSHGSGAHPRAGTASNGAPTDAGTSSTHATTAATAAGRVHDGQPVIGTAVPRTGGPFVAPRFFYSPYRGYYRVPNGFGGLGFYYDQFSSGYWPGGFGYRDYSYDYGAGNGYPDDTAVPSSQPAPPIESGNLRLLIDPPAAQVYVDGIFVGTVEDAGSALAGLRIGRGLHRLELTAPGYETLTVDVSIEADRTITYRGEMRRIPPQ